MPRAVHQPKPSTNAIVSDMSSIARSRTLAFLCAMVLPLCGLLIRPHVEIGINDDWSYIRTAQIFAQTRHLV